MKDRDTAILDNLNRFRCMTRNDIVDFHFSCVGLKNPVSNCNTVLKRLRRDGYITANTNMRPYVYFPIDGIKQNSTKIPHFLRIVSVYRKMCKYQKPKQFIVEPKYSHKGTVEPDAFCIWMRSPFFIEIQRSVYSAKVMNQKFKRYERYYDSGEWKLEPWQPQNRKIFPFILMITDTKYSINVKPKVIQVRSIDEFIRKEWEKRRKRVQTNGTIKWAVPN